MRSAKQCRTRKTLTCPSKQFSVLHLIIRLKEYCLFSYLSFSLDVNDKSSMHNQMHFKETLILCVYNLHYEAVISHQITKTKLFKEWLLKGFYFVSIYSVLLFRKKYLIHKTKKQNEAFKVWGSKLCHLELQFSRVSHPEITGP